MMLSILPLNTMSMDSEWTPLSTCQAVHWNFEHSATHRHRQTPHLISTPLVRRSVEIEVCSEIISVMPTWTVSLISPCTGNAGHVRSWEWFAGRPRAGVSGFRSFSGNVMSNFLGNHDVERFITHAAGEVSSIYGEGLCGGGDWRVDAQNPDWDEP